MWRCRLCEAVFNDIDGFTPVNVPPSHSGFRLFWSADRRLIHELKEVQEPVADATEAVETIQEEIEV
jgi:hypothetical protein